MDLNTEVVSPNTAFQPRLRSWRAQSCRYAANRRTNALQREHTLREAALHTSGNPAKRGLHRLHPVRRRLQKWYWRRHLARGLRLAPTCEPCPDMACCYMEDVHQS